MTQRFTVSIGVPTCDRASLLERALRSLVSQDYPNLEVVISDNASSDETAEVCERIQTQYPFVRYSRVPIRIPAFQNFKQVLVQSTGKYFMWAADDDLWEPDFLSTLVDQLESQEDNVLVAAEAQYVLPDSTKLPFFAEGSGFYVSPPRSQVRRLISVAKHNYGNLIYGLYRREALLTNSDGTVLDFVQFSNEIPLFIQVAARGGVQACKKVLFYKTTSLSTYLQAAREYGFFPVLDQMQGALSGAGQVLAVQTPILETKAVGARRRFFHAIGNLLRYCRHCASILAYHWATLRDIAVAIRQVDASSIVRIVVFANFVFRLVVHCLKLTVVWQVQDIFKKAKPKRSKRP